MVDVFGRLLSWMDGANPQLSVATAKRRFARHGWVVFPVSTGELAFFVNDTELGQYAVGISGGRTSREMVLDVAQQAAEQNVRAILVVSDAPGPPIREQAINQTVTLVQWQEVSALRDTIAAQESARRTTLAMAKTAARSQLPVLQRQPSVAFTAGQIAAGVVYATDHVSVFFVERGGMTVLITFGEGPTDADQPHRWGEGFCASGGFSSLHFQTSELNWFPHGDVSACIEAANERLADRFQTRFLVGSSQGGYAALKYSAALHATAVLAFSPQFSIDPAIHEDLRFGPYYRATLNSGMHIASADASGSASILYDPYDEVDAAQAERIGEALGPDLLPLPFSGHGASYIVQSDGAMVALVRAKLAGDAAAARRVVAGMRTRNPARAYVMALCLARRKPAVAYSLFDKYKDLLPTFIWEAVCYRLSQVGWGARTLGWLEGSTARKPDDPETSACLALVAAACEEFDLAYDAIQRSLRLRLLDEKYRHIQATITSRREALRLSAIQRSEVDHP